ncbi:hypothetical protein GOODEAATRI_003553 [Goodea atripinnis]|uniref:Uncharacterized protein n=1 Tax=Goodea atripinnis TaxID=208336 RepID=A0ABV0PVE6_9TELE
MGTVSKHHPCIAGIGFVIENEMKSLGFFIPFFSYCRLQLWSLCMLRFPLNHGVIQVNFRGFSVPCQKFHKSANLKGAVISSWCFIVFKRSCYFLAFVNKS